MIKEEIINKVINQIVLDVENHELDTVYELLDGLTITELIAYLPENTLEEINE